MNKMEKEMVEDHKFSNVGKSKAKENGEDVSKGNFCRCCWNYREAKVELEEVVKFLREPEKFKNIGAKNT